MPKRTRVGSDPSIYHFLVDRTQLPLPYWKYDDKNEIYHMDDGGSVAESGLMTAMSVCRKMQPCRDFFYYG